MAKEGKRGIGKIALVALVLLVAIGIFAGGESGSSDADTSGQQTTEGQATEQQAAEEQDPYTVSDEQLDTSNSFAVYIDGTLTNNTDDEVSYIQVQYNLYDADGAQVGTALANTNNLQPGGVWKFEAVGTASPDEVATFELMDVTGF